MTKKEYYNKLLQLNLVAASTPSIHGTAIRVALSELLIKLFSILENGKVTTEDLRLLTNATFKPGSPLREKLVSYFTVANVSVEGVF